MQEFPSHGAPRQPERLKRNPIRRRLAALSPVGNVETPTMLLSGEADLRTPISEAEKYYQALKLRGVDTALVRIPEAYHSIARRPSQLIAKVTAILACFERYAPGAQS